MKVAILTQTNYLGEVLRKGDTLGVEDKVAKRWISNGIATALEEERGIEQDVPVYDVRNNSPAGDLPGDSRSKSSNDELKATPESKRVSGSSNDRKHKSK